MAGRDRRSDTGNWRDWGGDADNRRGDRRRGPIIIVFMAMSRRCKLSTACREELINLVIIVLVVMSRRCKLSTDDLMIVVMLIIETVARHFSPVVFIRLLYLLTP